MATERRARTISDYLAGRSSPARGALPPASPRDGEPVYVAGGRKYLRKRVISRGAMGVIYEVEDIDCRRTVALKLLPSRPGLSSQETLRFITEAQITSQLEHPNIIPIHELGIDGDGHVFYTMKFVRGYTLADVLIGIRQGNPDTIQKFPLSRLLNAFLRVCEALTFAHARHVVHRDIKPSNIMLGDYGEVLLMDWGLAKQIAATPATPATGATHSLPALTTLRNDDSGRTLGTMKDLVLGSPGFMSPEQVYDHDRVDARTDIYGLGAVLYNILTLRTTVPRHGTMSVLKKIVSGDFPPPIWFNRDEAATREFAHCPNRRIPAILSDIAMRALATNPDERYPTVAALHEDVEAYQSGQIWVPVLDEDFTKQNIEDRWELVNGQWELRHGELVVRGGEPFLMMLREPVPGDVRIEYDGQQDGAILNDLSCFLGAVSIPNRRDVYLTGYEFKYGGFNNSMILLVRNDIRLWAKATSCIERGRHYHIVAERVGSRLRLLVNGQEVFRVYDANPLSGPQRNVVGLFGWSATTRYSRIRVYSLQAAGQSDLLDFADRQAQKGNYPMAEALYTEAAHTYADPAKARHAREGLDMALRNKTLNEAIPRTRALLRRAWPGRTFQIALDHDGLTLDISNARITDLSPLKGLPLRALQCANNRIRSLEPLRGMKLISLDCSGNPISSLEPLRTMALVKLVCECCEISDLKPLSGMPLQLLSAGGNPLGSLDCLRGIPLTNLYVWGTGIRDLDPLRGMPLTTLHCNANHITDLGPLEGVPLVSLNCAGNQIRSLEPLRGSMLRFLTINQNRITDLDPLRGTPICILTCTRNRIENLDALGGMPMFGLVCCNNRLRSLDPFIQHPPTNFVYDCDTLDDGEIRRARAVWRKRKDQRHLALEADVLLALRHGDRRALRDLARPVGNRRVLYIPKAMTWDQARAFCEHLGGHLFVVRSEQDHAQFESWFGSYWVWMGLQVTRRGPEWVTGESVDYTNFSSLLHATRLGPKVFAKQWSSQDEADFENCFVIEWGGPAREKKRTRISR